MKDRGKEKKKGANVEEKGKKKGRRQKGFETVYAEARVISTVSYKNNGNDNVYYDTRVI